jgi:hypothetical protein
VLSPDNKLSGCRKAKSAKETKIVPLAHFSFWSRTFQCLAARANNFAQCLKLVRMGRSALRPDKTNIQNL